MSNRSKEIPLVSRIGGNMIYYVAKLVGLLPYWFLYYVLAEIIYFIIYHVAGYRIKVVRVNLESSFPEKEKRELRLIERRFYRNLSEYVVDAIDVTSMSAKTLQKRANFKGIEELAKELDGRNWIDMMAHYGSWELFNSFTIHPNMGVMVAAYRPLKSRAMDLFYYKTRNRLHKTRTVPMHELLRFYMENRDGVDGMPIAIALIADQNPPVDSQSRWTLFLNHATVFFHGGEKIARKFGMPVYFMHAKKKKRGYYELWFEQIWDGVSPTDDHQITAKYGALLEADIIACPELWVWSHKRWKMSLEGDELKEFNKHWGTDIPDKPMYP